jgi:hypothetical protein
MRASWFAVRQHRPLRRRLLATLRKSRRYVRDRTHALRIDAVELATPLRAITPAA